MPHSRFSALNHRAYRTFWIGQGVSIVGTWMQTTARSWLVYELARGSGHEGGALGMVSLALAIPAISLSLPAGVLVDRFDRWRLVVACQVAYLFVAVSLTLLTLLGSITIWQVILLSLCQGVVNALEMPARQSWVVDLVPAEDRANAIALNSLAFTLARIVGPSLAGLLLAVAGASWCFFLNSLSFVAVLWSLFRIPHPLRTRGSTPPPTPLRESLGFIRRDPVVGPLLLMVGMMALVGMNYLVLTPLLAADVLHTKAQGYGVLMAAVGVGSLLAAAGLTLRSHDPTLLRGRRVLLGSLALGVSQCLVAVTGQFWVAVPLMALMGWGMLSQNTTSNTLLQERTPPHLRGRVLSIYSMFMLGMVPLGGLLAGLVADQVGVQWTQACSGVLCLTLVGLTYRYSPELSRI